MLNPARSQSTLTRITLVIICGLKSYDPLVDLTANTRNLVLAAAACSLTPSSAKSLVVKRCWRNYT